MTSDFSTKITKLKTALENVFVKKADIKDNLTSTDTNKPLSAKQGKVLNEGKQATLVSGTNIKTINNNSILGSGNLTISGGSGDSLLGISDYYLDSSTEELVLEYSTGKLINSISKSTSGLTDTYTITYTDSSTYQFTVTNGQDGNVDIVTSTNGWNSTTSDTKVPSEKLVKNSLDTKLDATHSSYKGKNVVTNASTGAIEFEDKPTIPTKVSDLSNDSNFISTSNTTGLIKNDGSIDTSTYLTSHQSLSDYIQKSQTTGLVKNDGSIDTSTYLTTGTASSTYVAKETGKGLFSGSYSDLTNKPSYTATITSSNTGAYEIGSTNINGSNVSIYGVDKQGKIIGTNETLYTAIDTGYCYRIWLETSGGKLMPVNTSSSTSATANKSSYMNTRDFYLNGRIFYCNVNDTTNANATFTANTCYQQVDLTLGFSFNNTGSALSLTVNKPVYMIAEDRGNGMGRLTSPYFTQTLPSSADNKLYIYLGHSISETTIELALKHPIYEYKGSSIRLFREYYTSSEIDSLIGSAITLINGNGGNS